jgi:hypothetical protein
MKVSAKEANDDPRKRDEEKKLRRLVIADSDLWQAYRFIELLLKYECQDLETDDDRSVRDLVTALDIALVVAYCRPFLQSKGGRRKNTALQLQGQLLRVYSDDEKKLHLAIVEQRNSEFAHSDADSYSPTISKTPFGPMHIMRNPSHS